MVRKFEYRGVPTAELETLPLAKLSGLFNARQRRSLNRGITASKWKLIEKIKRVKAGQDSGSIKTHLRDLIIMPYMVGVTVEVYSGKAFQPVTVSVEMIGHYIGEYVITNKRVNHGAPGVGASRSSLYVPLK